MACPLSVWALGILTSDTCRLFPWNKIQSLQYAAQTDEEEDPFSVPPLSGANSTSEVG